MAHEAQPSVSLTLFLYFEVFCDLLLNRPMPTWNLFVLYDKEKKCQLSMVMSSMDVYLPIHRK